MTGFVPSDARSGLSGSWHCWQIRSPREFLGMSYVMPPTVSGELSKVSLLDQGAPLTRARGPAAAGPLLSPPRSPPTPRPACPCHP